MDIRFFFEYDGLVVQLPVNPSELKIATKGSNKTEEIIKLGEVNILKDKKLSSIKLESFLPMSSNYPYVLTPNRFEDAKFYIDFFDKIRIDKKPMRFIVTDTTLNMLVSIETFDYWLQAGEDDYYFTLELKEYRVYSPKIVQIMNPPTTETTSSTSTETTKKATTSSEKRTSNGISVGDTVEVSGKYYFTSYGDEPTGTFNNYKGKVIHIVMDKDRPYRFCIENRGWVAYEQIKGRPTFLANLRNSNARSF